MADTYREKLLEVAEASDWSCHCDQEGVEFSKYSPAGEDFSFYVRAKTGEDILIAVQWYARCFDADEHAAEWIVAKQNGSTTGIPDIRTLIKDADDIQTMLDELVSELEEVDPYEWGEEEE